MNHLVLSNAALLLENHWMLFYHKEKKRQKTPQKTQKTQMKEKRDPQELSAWLKRAPTETC